ncbi:hypothetical protein D9M73_214240 [compost metagenome]
MQRVIHVAFIAQADFLAAVGKDAQRRLGQRRHGAHAFFVLHQVQVVDGRFDADAARGVTTHQISQLLALLFQGGVEGSHCSTSR